MMKGPSPAAPPLALAPALDNCVTGAPATAPSSLTGTAGPWQPDTPRPLALPLALSLSACFTHSGTSLSAVTSSLSLHSHAGTIVVLTQYRHRYILPSSFFPLEICLTASFVRNKDPLCDSCIDQCRPRFGVCAQRNLAKLT